MMFLTQQKAIEKRKAERAARRTLRQELRCYNTASAMKGNPFKGDTTVLDRTIDNRTDRGCMTEEDVLEAVMFPERHNRLKRSDVKLCPDMVTEDVKEFYRAKIGQGAVRSARALRAL